MRNLIVIFALVAASCDVPAQQAPIVRVDLQRHDLSIPGREVVQVRVDLAPGVTAPGHTHPGEEVIYVLAGEFEYVVGDEQPLRLGPGDVLFVPAETTHSARNVGAGVASELATYIVAKDRPLSTPAR
jgi:quercetin dioxygenase-like cupin family protein